MQEFEHNKSLVKRNILTYLKTLGVSKYEFYKVSGLSRGTLDNSSGMTEENILKFLAYAKDVSLEWLLLGKGEMLKSTTETSDPADDNHELHIAAEGRPKYLTSRIPLYSVRNTKAMIALFETPEEAAPVDYLLVPDLDNCDGALFVSGDSMYPLLNGGDIVIYKTLKDKNNSWFWGEIYLLVISVEGEEMTLIGYIQKSEKGDDYITLRSYNPQHQQKDIRLDQILGFALIKASIRIS